ncbi:MAG TPA: Omp28-related outer membrane protein [Flavipsychrobacter sp.]
MYRKSSLWLAAASLLIVSCNKTVDTAALAVENPDNQVETPKSELTFTKATMPVMLEFTSTGCPGCGSWGKPTFARVAADYVGKITPLAVHIKYGDPMITDESNAIGANRYGNFYTPQIWVADSNAVILNGGSISGASEQNMRRMLDITLQQVQPALAAKLSKEDGKLVVTYGVKFIDIMPEGEYALACYLTEDGIKAQQTSSAINPATHNHVLRASAAGAFGKPFASSDLTDNEKSWAHTFTLDSKYNADNVYITLVLWKKTGTRYSAINGYIAK